MGSICNDERVRFGVVSGHDRKTLSRQPGQEGLDLGAAQICGVTQAMEVHEAAHPMNVGLLRPYAVVKVADLAAQLIQQTKRGRINGHGVALQGREAVQNNSIQPIP